MRRASLPCPKLVCAHHFSGESRVSAHLELQAVLGPQDVCTLRSFIYLLIFKIYFCCKADLQREVDTKRDFSVHLFIPQVIVTARTD